MNADRLGWLKDDIRTVYQGDLSSRARNIVDIDIEQEFLYWANDSHSDGHGGVHKAFTEPFLKPEPFQTYEITDVKEANNITLNEHYLFFTGTKAGSNERELFIQKKHGAGMYYHYG